MRDTREIIARLARNESDAVVQIGLVALRHVIYVAAVLHLHHDRQVTKLKSGPSKIKPDAERLQQMRGDFRRIDVPFVIVIY